MIVNLRGTHGSGKSTVAANLLKQNVNYGMERSDNGRVIVYGMEVLQLRPQSLYLIGPYATACGGCDAIQPYSDIWPLVEKYAKKGHVFFEGALISTSLGVIGEAMAARKDCVVAYLDTPLDKCLERIVARRAAKGNTKSLNPKNTASKVAAIERTRARFEALGVRTATIDHRKAVPQVLALFRKGIK